MKEGFGLVPEDRKQEGLFLQSDIRFNTTINVVDRFLKKLVWNRSKENQIVSEKMEGMHIKATGASQMVSKLSGGNQQKVLIGRWLCSTKSILILDEPTNGLDPSGIHEIRNLIKSLPDFYECTVMISSHMLSEIELMADDIGILNHGRLLFEGSLDDLRRNARQAGMSTDNLEDVFLSIVEQDNAARKQRAKL